MNEKIDLRIVSIGGGNGLSVLLHGLKRYPVDITAVVTVSDDGGSSGRLRREFDVLPPGDIRNCMVALSEDEALLSRLFQYRFSAGRGLKGHSFGNLFLMAMTQVVGSFSEAVKTSSEVLKIAGRIYPSTETNVTLEAVLANGAIVRGETQISRSRPSIDSIRLNPQCCPPHPATLQAIADADLITLGPGSLFTSVIPNLLVEGIASAIQRSRALKAYLVNLMWQPGETMHFTASDHVRAIEKHAGGRLLDYALINTQPIRPALRKRYAREQALPVQNDPERIREMGIEVVGGNFLLESEKIRHNPEAIAAAVMRLALESREARNTQGGNLRSKAKSQS
jgi:uncharacterized cofD-like protein